METCEDYMVQCPYNRSHVIRRSRIQQHIVKCERNFPGLVMEWCPHNASHRFARHEDYMAHVPNCPDARINSNVLIMMAMKYHEMGDVCKVKCDPDRHNGSDEDWALEYVENSGSSSETKVGDRQQNVSDNSCGGGSCDTEEGDVDDVTRRMASLDVSSEVSVLDQIKPYSVEESTALPVKMHSDEVQRPIQRKACSLIENNYLRGISIGRGKKLSWLDGKPGKATYQKSVERQEIASESTEKSVGRGFSARSCHPGQHGQSLRKPASSYHLGL